MSIIPDGAYQHIFAFLQAQKIAAPIFIDAKNVNPSLRALMQMLQNLQDVIELGYNGDDFSIHIIVSPEGTVTKEIQILSEGIDDFIADFAETVQSVPYNPKKPALTKIETSSIYAKKTLFKIYCPDYYQLLDTIEEMAKQKNIDTEHAPKHKCEKDISADDQETLRAKLSQRGQDSIFEEFFLMAPPKNRPALTYPTQNVEKQLETIATRAVPLPQEVPNIAAVVKMAEL